MQSIPAVLGLTKFHGSHYETMPNKFWMSDWELFPNPSIQEFRIGPENWNHVTGKKCFLHLWNIVLQKCYMVIGSQPMISRSQQEVWKCQQFSDFSLSQNLQLHSVICFMHQCHRALLLVEENYIILYLNLINHICIYFYKQFLVLKLIQITHCIIGWISIHSRARSLMPKYKRGKYLIYSSVLLFFLWADIVKIFLKICTPIYHYVVDRTIYPKVVHILIPNCEYAGLHGKGELSLQMQLLL